MEPISLTLAETVGLSVVVIFIGKFLVAKIGFLNKFLIPYPVVGGLVFAIVTLIGYSANLFELKLDTTLQDYFMICFFTTVGFTASIKVLKAGGIGVALFLLCAFILTIIQNGVAVGISSAMGMGPLFGMVAGSIPMTGGHGTSGAFGPVLEQYGVSGGLTYSIAAATFGLISGSLIGGPVARRLIVKHDLKPTEPVHEDAAGDIESDTGGAVLLNENSLSLAFFQVALAVGIGYYISMGISALGVVVPSYIGSMLAAAVMRNVFKDGSKFEMKIPEIQALGSLFLAIFLAQALMNLKLWQLADGALPMFVILICQVIIMVFYATFVTFNVMGKDYDAAVLAAGHCGFGLGATPNGVANMTAVVTKYGPSTKAFFILPIVGGLFIDFVNAAGITFFLNIFK
ncbi:sodium/glutamate symporter [Mycoplasma sp. P36-A1]|uniref:sodium/glutamate symporter n=1 Tax=Mycoplasma sp. P36-A1 TaxID=3252900 RepID=UPI003C307EE5